MVGGQIGEGRKRWNDVGLFGKENRGIYGCYLQESSVNDWEIYKG